MARYPPISVAHYDVCRAKEEAMSKGENVKNNWHLTFETETEFELKSDTCWFPKNKPTMVFRLHWNW